jgi:hypothetical protein
VYRLKFVDMDRDGPDRRRLDETEARKIQDETNRKAAEAERVFIEQRGHRKTRSHTKPRFPKLRKQTWPGDAASMTRVLKEDISTTITLTNSLMESLRELRRAYKDELQNVWPVEDPTTGKRKHNIQIPLQPGDIPKAREFFNQIQDRVDPGPRNKKRFKHSSGFKTDLLECLHKMAEQYRRLDYLQSHIHEKQEMFQHRKHRNRTIDIKGEFMDCEGYYRGAVYDILTLTDFLKDKDWARALDFVWFKEGGLGFRKRECIRTYRKLWSNINQKTLG